MLCEKAEDQLALQVFYGCLFFYFTRWALIELDCKFSQWQGELMQVRFIAEPIQLGRRLIGQAQAHQAYPAQCRHKEDRLQVVHLSEYESQLLVWLIVLSIFLNL